MSKLREALSHAKAYTWEYIDRLVTEKYKKGDEKNNDYMLPEVVHNGIENNNTIDELCDFITKIYEEHGKSLGNKNWNNMWGDNGLSLSKSVRNYYNAMLLMDIGEYTGTEDRLYYRVYESATSNSSESICVLEPNLCLIAKRFYDVGAITKNQLNSFRTRYTLKKMSSGYYSKKDGSIDVDRILESIKPEYHNTIYDMKILNAAR